MPADRNTADRGRYDGPGRRAGHPRP